MAYFRCGGGVPSSVKTLPTYKTASGSVATFNTDLTENLVEVKCQIVAIQSGSGTPSPSNPRPIQTYTSLNLSHSGSDTSNPTVYNISLGQTVANGVLDITTGKLKITKGFVNMWELGWILSSSGYFFADYTPIKANSGWATVPDLMCTNYQADTPNNIASKINNERISIWPSGHRVVLYDNNYATPTALVTALQNATSQLVFELDTPIEIQLDSITLQALLNENNIWCDTGDTSVKYILSVGEALRQG